MAGARLRVTLDPDDIEAIANRLAEKLAGREPGVVRCVDVAAAARRLSMSTDWVREHAAELGGAKMGEGKRAVLRFDVRQLDQAYARWQLEKGTPRSSRRPGRPTGSLGFELLTSRRGSVAAAGSTDGR